MFLCLWRHDKIVKSCCIQFSLSHNHRTMRVCVCIPIHYPSEENSISDEQYDGALCCVCVQRREIFWLLYECLETVCQVVYENTHAISLSHFNPMVVTGENGCLCVGKLVVVRLSCLLLNISILYIKSYSRRIASIAENYNVNVAIKRKNVLFGLCMYI